MKNLKNFLIASSLLMGCNVTVYGADEGCNVHNRGLRQLQPQEIAHGMCPDECRKMVMMLLDDDFVSKDAVKKSNLFKKQNSSDVQRALLPVFLNEVTLDYGISFYQSSLPRVLFVQKNDKVVASCITGFRCDDDEGFRGYEIKKAVTTQLEQYITFIRRQYGNIPIQVCGAWKRCFSVPRVLSKGENDKIYFLNSDAHVDDLAQKQSIFKQGGTLLLNNASGRVQTAAKNVFMGKPRNNCELVCLYDHAFIEIHDFQYGVDEDRKKVVCLALQGHEGQVKVGSEGLRIKMTGIMGVFDMDSASSALIQNAYSSNKFSISYGGIAFVINSKLGAIDAHGGGCVVLVNSDYKTAKWDRNDYTNIFTIDDVCDLEEVLPKVKNLLNEKYKLDTTYGLKWEKKANRMMARLKDEWDSFRGDMKFDGRPKTRKIHCKNIVLGTKTDDQLYKYADSESESDQSSSSQDNAVEGGEDELEEDNGSNSSSSSQNNGGSDSESKSDQSAYEGGEDELEEDNGSNSSSSSQNNGGSGSESASNKGYRVRIRLAGANRGAQHPWMKNGHDNGKLGKRLHGPCDEQGPTQNKRFKK